MIDQHKKLFKDWVVKTAVIGDSRPPRLFHGVVVVMEKTSPEADDYLMRFRNCPAIIFCGPPDKPEFLNSTPYLNHTLKDGLYYTEGKGEPAPAILRSLVV